MWGKLRKMSYNDDMYNEYTDMNTPTGGITMRSRSRTLEMESRILENDSEPEVTSNYLDPPDWLGQNMTTNHPDWTDEDVRYHLDSLWNELSTEEQRQFTSQGTEIVYDGEFYEDEVLDSGIVGEDVQNITNMPPTTNITNIYNIRLPPPPPPPKIIPDSHPDGDDEVGIEGLTCVICMENKVKIFPRCGHVCACIKCSKGICLNSGRCPLCREYWCDLRMMYFPM